MSFSRIAWVTSTLYMVLVAFLAWKEGTFTSGYVTIGFINHGGMWGDFLILPLVNGLIFPYFPRITVKRTAAASGLLVFATIVTIFAHEQWAAMGKAQGVTDFAFPSHTTGVWHSDMSAFGYLHMAYMSIELTLILIYAVVSMPVPSIYWISGLLTVHLILGQVQPAWYATGNIWNSRTLLATLTTVFLTWLVGLYKIRQERRLIAAPAGV